MKEAVGNRHQAVSGALPYCLLPTAYCLLPCAYCLHPTEAGLGQTPRLVLGADPAVIAEAVEMRENMGIVDLALVRLGTARHGGDLDMADDRQQILEPAGQVALGDLEVVAVEHQLDVGAPGPLDDGGGRVTRVEDGKWKRAGVQEDFVITHLDKVPVDNVEDLNKILQIKNGGMLVEGVSANGQRGTFGVDW